MFIYIHFFIFRILYEVKKIFFFLIPNYNINNFKNINIQYNIIKIYFNYYLSFKPFQSNLYPYLTLNLENI